MSTLLSTSPTVSAVSVNSEMCDRVAQLIASENIPEDREQIRSLDIPSLMIGNFFLSLVAICHRTSSLNQKPLIGTINGVIKRGWDYLFERFYGVVCSNLILINTSHR